MKFLIDECLHTSLVALATTRKFEAWHVNWLGLSGTADWKLMPRIIADDLTFVTNNARDFRRLYAREPLHAGLVVIVPQATPSMQRRLFAMLLDGPELQRKPVNEAIEITIEDGTPIITRYDLSDPAT